MGAAGLVFLEMPYRVGGGLGTENAGGIWTTHTASLLS